MTQGAELAAEFWAKTLLGADACWASTPIPVTELAMSSAPLIPRFAIREQRGSSEPKIRLIDDFRASAANHLVSTQDTDIPQNLDIILSIASLFEQLQPGCQAMAFSVDFCRACKNIPLPAVQQDCATILISPPDGAPPMAQLRTQPFGPKRSPANWARATAFLRLELATVFHITVSVFVGDFYVIKTCETLGSAFLVAKEFCGLLWLDIEVEKEQPKTTDVALIDANLRLRPVLFEARLPSTKRNSYAHIMRDILPRGALIPVEAAKVRGKLRYALTPLFGRSGRASLPPFTARQYCPEAGRASDLSIESRDVIPGRIARMGELIPRRVFTTWVRPVVIYTDASGPGHLGCVVVCAGVRYTAQTHLPAWVMRAKAGIFEYELCALGLVLACTVSANRPVLQFCGNMGIAGAVIRGSRKTTLGRIITSVFWNGAPRFSMAVWVGYVDSTVNTADPPAMEFEIIPTEEHMACDANISHQIFLDIFYSRHTVSSATFNMTPNVRISGKPLPCAEQGGPCGLVRACDMVGADLYIAFTISHCHQWARVNLIGTRPDHG